MCIHIRKPLNPRAPEWRPTPRAQLLRLPYHHPAPTFPGFHFHDRSNFYTAAKPLPAEDLSKETEILEVPRSENTPITNTTTHGSVFNKRRRMGRLVLPPRLQRRVRGVPRPPPPPPPRRRQEWRPKKPQSHGGAPPSTHLSHSSPTTTVMIKNIPNQLRRDFMLKFLDGYCKAYSLAYDFLYLPMDFRRKDNLGYAFVNFTTTEAAKQFKKVLDNYKWGVIQITPQRTINSKKICEITWARVQGKEALIRRFQYSNFMCKTMDFLPVVLDPPRDGSDPDPAPPVVVGSLSG